MSAKKLGRFAAGLFVAIGLALGGAALAVVDGGDAPVSSATSITATIYRADIDWQ